MANFKIKILNSMWKRNIINSLDNIPLVYYKIGNRKEYIIFVNAVGASILLWIPIINLLAKDYTIIAFEYRGFPNNDIELSEDACKFKNLLTDLEIIINTEEIKKAHIISWCYGQKLMFEFYRIYPDRCVSLCLIGMGFGELEEENNMFTKTIYHLKRNVTNHPETFMKIINMLRNLAILPKQNDLQNILSNQYLNFGDLTLIVKNNRSKVKEFFNRNIHRILISIGFKTSSKAIEFLNDAIPSSQKVYMNSATNLLNYFNLVVEIGNHKVVDVFDEIKVPITLIYGEKDTLATKKSFDIISMKIPKLNTFIIKDAAHYNISSDFGEKLYKSIYCHLKN
jgi:pimeloyl-ACP methyl ester carboxylesterase